MCLFHGSCKIIKTNGENVIDLNTLKPKQCA